MDIIARAFDGILFPTSFYFVSFNDGKMRGDIKWISEGKRLHNAYTMYQQINIKNEPEDKEKGLLWIK